MADWAILGCGYVGGRLARTLTAAGERVRVCARNTTRLEPLGALGVQVQAFDATKSRAFSAALYGLTSPNVVYSIPPLPNRPSGEPLRRACEAATSVGANRFVYFSSTAVYGETPDGEIVDEDSSVALADPEAASRIGDESAVDVARLSGLHTIVLRLAAVYGPGRGVRERLKAGTYKLIDDGAHHFSRVHVDDIVGIVRAAVARAPAGAVYCVGDDKPTTQREYADWLVARLGVAQPISVASLAPSAPRRAVRNRQIANARVKRELAYVFSYPSYVEGEVAIEQETGGGGVKGGGEGKVVTSAPPAAPLALTSAVASPATPTTTAAAANGTNPFDVGYGKGSTEYERYLRTPELLALQKPPETRTHSDELFFQSVHQVEEIWMKMMVHDLGEYVVHLDADRDEDARHALGRVRELGMLLERQLKLFETMLPGAYLVIRKGLGRGSGLDSPGFVRLNEIAPAVYAAFQRAIERRRVDLMELYARPATHPPLLFIAEGLVDIDAAMQRFKREHIMVVRRIIGIGTSSLRGNPMDLLERSAQLTWFPSLWAVRDGMFSDFKVGALET
jgi:tryptophan 2,3-dioxygenase